MNKIVQEKFEKLIKTLDNFVSEVNSNETEYCWTYDYSTNKPDHFTLYEMDKNTGATIDEIEIPCRSD